MMYLPLPVSFTSGPCMTLESSLHPSDWGHWRMDMRGRHLIGNLIVICFILVQILDWLATFHGVTLFGTSIEANPLLRFLMERYDIILVLTLAKLSATLAATFLHLFERHLMVATLTLLYAVFALIPWINVLGIYRFF